MSWIAERLRELADELEYLEMPVNGRPASPEPPPDAWLQIGEHEWATDGHCAVRRAGPRPARKGAWITTDPLPDIGQILPSLCGWVRLEVSERLEPSRDGDTDWPQRVVLTGSEGCERVIESWGASMLWGCNAYADPNEPISPIAIVSRDDGELVAIVMPLRAS